MFEKLVNSKLNAVADWIIRLVMINIFMIICSLPVITIFPALSAGYNLLHDYVEGKHTPLVKGYFGYFKEYIGRKIVVGIVIGILLVVSYTNIRYYVDVLETNETLFFQIGYYATLALIAALYAVILYTVVVLNVESKMKLVSLFKLSFFLAGKYYFITVLLVVINSLPVFLLFTPITSLIFVFMGLSIPLTLHALLTKNAVYYLEGLGNEND